MVNDLPVLRLNGHSGGLPMTDLRKSLILRKFVITALCHIFLG